MNSAQRSGLALVLSEYEENDEDKGDYLSIQALVQVRGFAGESDFWIARADLESYLVELDALDESLAGRAHLRCGWGEAAHFDLTIEPLGHGGRLVARVEVASRGVEDGMDSARVAFVLLPNALTSFRRRLRRFLEGAAAEEAVLEAETRTAA